MRIESQLQKEVINYLKSKAIYHINIYGSGFTAKGTPDLIICLNGKFIALELKTPKKTGKESPAQKIRAKQIINSKGIYLCMDNLDEIKDKLKELEC